MPICVKAVPLDTYVSWVSSQFDAWPYSAEAPKAKAKVAPSGGAVELSVPPGPPPQAGPVGPCEFLVTRRVGAVYLTAF